jgi:superoxide dismutase, Cu-Zn family
MKLTLVLGLLMMSACAHNRPAATGGRQAMATLESGRKNVAGEVSVMESQQGILVSILVRGLKPGAVHAIHVHEHGKCEGPKYESAGDHFNPHGTKHAGPAAPEKHAGDFGNVVANQQGVARKEILQHPHMGQGHDLFAGKSIILHAGPDDLQGQPSGNSGDRIACGIVQLKED